VLTWAVKIQRNDDGGYKCLTGSSCPSESGETRWSESGGTPWIIHLLNHLVEKVSSVVINFIFKDWSRSQAAKTFCWRILCASVFARIRKHPRPRNSIRIPFLRNLKTKSTWSWCLHEEQSIFTGSREQDAYLKLWSCCGRGQGCQNWNLTSHLQPSIGKNENDNLASAKKEFHY